MTLEERAKQASLEYYKSTHDLVSKYFKKEDTVEQMLETFKAIIARMES